MIDLHAHILYDLDDGASTLEESLEMARIAVADGIHTIAATPHSPASIASRHYSPALIVQRLDQLRAALQSAGIELHVVQGTEIAYDGGIVEQLRRGDLLTYGSSRAVLLELSSNRIPPTLENALFNLQVAGYRIVLAHPERIVEVQQDPNLLIPLIERGVCMQITASTLIGEQGRHLQHVCETLLSHAMVHIIASDTHSTSSRPPKLTAAREYAATLIGPAQAETFVTSIPMALLENQPLRLPQPKRVK
ncbi:MAG: CpsB/CapC family capsule biosynthesis tyrosine phosphatase [Chloroflexota bacterium]